jgi:hypothetical protein
LKCMQLRWLCCPVGDTLHSASLLSHIRPCGGHSYAASNMQSCSKNSSLRYLLSLSLPLLPLLLARVISYAAMNMQSCSKNSSLRYLLSLSLLLLLLLPLLSPLVSGAREQGHAAVGVHHAVIRTSIRHPVRVLRDSRTTAAAATAAAAFGAAACCRRQQQRPSSSNSSSRVR